MSSTASSSDLVEILSSRTSFTCLPETCFTGSCGRYAHVWFECSDAVVVTKKNSLRQNCRAQGNDQSSRRYHQVVCSGQVVRGIRGERGRHSMGDAREGHPTYFPNICSKTCSMTWSMPRMARPKPASERKFRTRVQS